jgi:polar amino acid transport system substrate-binding protein
MTDERKNGRTRRAFAAALVLGCAFWTPVAERARAAALVFGGDQDYPPYEYLNDKGKPVGFNVDIIRAVARELGEPIEVRLGRWPEIIREFEVGRTVHITDLFYTEERARRVEYTVPFAIVYDEVFVRRESPQACVFENLAGKEVIVQRASTTEEYLSNHARGAKPVPVDSEPAALRLLAAGFHDCAIVRRVTGRLAIQKYGLTNLVTSGRPIRPRDYAFVVHKGNLALRDRLNAALNALEASGEYQQTYDRWFGALEPPTRAQTFLRAYGGWAAVTALLLAAMILGWNRTLAARVEMRTAALSAATRRQRDLFDNANDAIFVVEPESGRIWVESEPGRGSAFWIALPDSVIVSGSAPEGDRDATSKRPESDHG